MTTDRKLLFWDVDTQVDFMHPDGKLYVPGAEKVIPEIQRLNRWAEENSVTVVSSMCAHQPNDPEFADYPPHCIVGTGGQNKVEGTALANQFIIPNRKIDLPADVPSYHQIIIEKQDTNVFTNPNVGDLLRRLGPDREVILYGVVTEICVEKAAHGLIARGYRVNVVEDAIRHLDAQKGRATIDYVVQHGGRVLKTDDVMHALAH